MVRFEIFLHHTRDSLVVQYLPCICEALGLALSTAIKQKRKKKLTYHCLIYTLFFFLTFKTGSPQADQVSQTIQYELFFPLVKVTKITMYQHLYFTNIIQHVLNSIKTSRNWHQCNCRLQSHSFHIFYMYSYMFVCMQFYQRQKFK